jgi:ATP-dependent RNA helicase RhlB
MPLQLIRKLASRLLSRAPAADTTQPASRKGHDAPSQQRGRRAHPPAPNATGPGHTRRPERPAAAEGASSRPAPAKRHGDRAPDAPRHGDRPAERHPDRQGERAPDRRGDRPPRSADRRGDRPPRGAREAGRTTQGHTPSDETRPGGLVADAETERRRAAHAAWDPASFQVPVVEGKTRFQEFDLPAEILHAIADQKFEYCTPIQARSLAQALAGQNVAGRAQTGTGKTAAFLIALLTRYLRHPAGRPSKVATPRALVIAPTRELVIQICRDADSLGKYCGLRYLAVYGGMDHDRQRRELTAGPVDLLVATPGRLLDYVQSRVLDLSHVDTLVVDEADRMLDMGFIPDVRRIVSRLPPADRRCTMLYSATLDDEVMRLASQWMTNPVRVEVEPESVAVKTVTQQVYVVTAREKFTVLYNLLRRHAGTRVLVFCNRRDSTEHVAEKLRRQGIPCEMLSGDVQQNRRLRALEDFRSGKVRVVVATDVAGRGIHVDDVGFVVNYDFPYEPEDYVHRIGRTGRAGRIGTAISFADENESFAIPEIEKFLGEPLVCSQPEDDLLQAPPDHRGGRGGHPRHEAHTARREESAAPAPAAEERREAPAAPVAPVEESPVAPHAGHAPEWPDSPPVAPPPPERPLRSKAEHPPHRSAHPPAPVVLPSAARRPTEFWAPGDNHKA